MRILRKLAIVTGIGCLLAIGFLYLAWRVHVTNAEEALAMVLAELDQDDPGWRLEQLEAAEDAPSTGHSPSALDMFVEAAQVMPKQPWPYWAFPEFASDPTNAHLARRTMQTSLTTNRTHLFNSTQLRVLKSELERAAPSLRKLHQILEAPRTSLRSDNPKREVLCSGPDFSLLKMLDHEACINAHEQNMHEAMKDLQVLFAIARISNEAPDMFTQIHWTGIVGRTFTQCIGRVLALGEASESDLANLQVELEQAARVPRLLIGLRGERARIDAILEKIQGGDMTVGEACPELAQCRMLLLTADLGTEFRSRLYFDIVRERGDFLRACMPFLELARMDPASREQAMAQQALTPPVAANASSTLVPFNPRFTTAFDKHVFKENGVFQTNLQAAYAAVAAERYRLKHGCWPQNLTDLVPQFLTKVPGQLAGLASGGLIQEDGNFKVGIMLLHAPRQRRQPPLPWVFTPKKTSTAKKQ